MERGSITKWLLLGLALVLFWTYGKKFFVKPSAPELQPIGAIHDSLGPTGAPPPDQACTLDGGGFKAVLSSRGASLRQVTFSDPRYRVDAEHKPLDLVTTSRPARMPLRTDLRLPLGDGSQQMALDDVDWQLAPGADGKTCTYTYADATTSLKKIVALGSNPNELTVTVDVQNLAAEPKVHRFAIEQTDYRRKKEMEGHLGRQDERLTEVVAVTDKKTERHGPGDFEPGDFKKPEFTAEKWRRTPGDGKVAAVSSMFFTKLVAPIQGPGTPVAETLVEEVWSGSPANKEDAPDYGYVYRARVAFPEVKLAPKETATYKAIAYVGPKDRDLLAKVDHGATEVLNLGTFATIARFLVTYLRWLYGIVGSWGWAIVVLTVTVRTMLFPLSLTQIKSSMAMRKLKPEMDAINEKYKDDAAQKGLAIQELWRKNNVTNPVLGCLPMLVQMPVWWALYTALQTAVELYHVPFGPFIPDLTSPGKYFIIPIVLGASSFFQQKLMPAQGDAQQQKMMMYMMPAVFTFMMLFLPAGLGVYMLTNSVLAIVQQLAVERYLKGHTPSGPGDIKVREKSSGDGDRPAPALGKGKARARG